MQNKWLDTGKRVARSCAVPTFLLLFGTVVAFAQVGSDPFSAAASGISTTAITVGRYIAGILAVICGVRLMASERHGPMEVMGLLFGATFTLFAVPIVTWIQSL